MTATVASYLFILQASVSGTIAFPAGTSPADTTITLVGEASTVSAKAGPDGMFSLGNVPPGVYKLQMLQKRRALTVPTFLVEAGANDITLYWPTDLKPEERSAQATTAYSQGSMSLSAGRYEEAAAAFKRALEVDTGLAPAWASLALALVGMQKYEDALAPGMMAIRFAPDVATYRNNMGSTLFRLRRYDEALRRYREAAQRNAAGKGMYLTNAAVALMALGRDREAAAAFREAVTDANVPETSWYHYGALSAREGDPDEARRAFRKYLEIQPNGIMADEARRHLQALGG